VALASRAGLSACLVSSSTLLTEVGRRRRPDGVQGVSDLTMGLVAAAAGVLAGPVLSAFGYPSLAAVAGVLLVPVVVLLIRAGDGACRRAKSLRPLSDPRRRVDSRDRWATVPSSQVSPSVRGNRPRTL